MGYIRDTRSDGVSGFGAGAPMGLQKPAEAFSTTSGMAQVTSFLPIGVPGSSGTASGGSAMILAAPIPGAAPSGSSGQYVATPSVSTATTVAMIAPKTIPQFCGFLSKLPTNTPWPQVVHRVLNEIPHLLKPGVAEIVGKNPDKRLELYAELMSKCGAQAAVLAPVACQLPCKCVCPK